MRQFLEFDLVYLKLRTTDRLIFLPKQAFSLFKKPSLAWRFGSEYIIELTFQKEARAIDISLYQYDKDIKLLYLGSAAKIPLSLCFRKDIMTLLKIFTDNTPKTYTERFVYKILNNDSGTELYRLFVQLSIKEPKEWKSFTLPMAST